MNWYKKAKLSDKDKNPDKSIFLRCMYCKNFLTSPNGIYSEEDRQDMANWKSVEEMDAEERFELNIAINSRDIKDPIGISDGMCPRCKKNVMDKEIAEFVQKKQLRDQQTAV